VALPLAFTLSVGGAPALIRSAEVVQAQAAEAGFAATLRQIDPARLLATLRARDFDMCASPWSGRYDPDGNMYGWLTPGGAFNFSGYAAPAMTDLLQRARGLADPAARAALYRQAQALAAEDAPLLFLHHDAMLQAARAGVAWTAYPDGVLRL
jgi:peptide/nickel transport system substrate-binding protein